jgi:hypothetical protein
MRGKCGSSVKRGWYTYQQRSDYETAKYMAATETKTTPDSEGVKNDRCNF